MKKHTPVTFDFDDNTLTIFRNSQQLVLKGLTEQDTLRLLNAKSIHKLVKNR